jgi:hypothetical protein
MKKNIIVYAVTLSFFCILFGCKKNDTVIPQVDESKLESILAMAGDDQLTAFNMLRGDEKVAIHELHINKYTARKSFNPVQKALINEFLGFNKSEYYDLHSDAREAAITYFAKSWLDRAKNCFSPDEIYTIAFSLDDIELRVDRMNHQFASNSSGNDLRNQLNPDRSPYNNESLSNCFCNVGSSFTCPQFSFTLGTETKTTAVRVGYAPCSYLYLQPCDTEGGCGFAGWSTCDGNKCA